MTDYKKNETIEYYCQKIKLNVKITTRIIVIGEDDTKIPTSIKCDHCLECGVGKKIGISISNDWKECVYPRMKE